MPSATTWHLMRLTRLLNIYFERLACGTGFFRCLPGTTLQLTKNLQSRWHRDKNNQGPSYITGLGSYVGGQLFVEDKNGDMIFPLQEAIPGVGSKGECLQGHIESIRKHLVEFDGNRAHGTLPFKGERFSVIRFCLGTESYNDTPSTVKTFLERLGFTMPEPDS